MRKVQVWAVFWTIIIAIPFTTLALIAAAYLTDHLAEIAGSIASIDFFTFAKYRDLILEIELLGVVLGVFIIIAVIHITLQTGYREDHPSYDVGSEQFASEFKMRNYTGKYDSSGKFDNPTNGFSRRYTCIKQYCCL